MKKIINGRKYDTNTAQEIDSYTAHVGSFQYVREILYRKKNGEFFIYGEGGPASGYAVSIDYNSWSGGQAIRPMTETNARLWLENHSDVCTYESVFGEVEE